MSLSHGKSIAFCKNHRCTYVFYLAIGFQKKLSFLQKAKLFHILSKTRHNGQTCEKAKLFQKKLSFSQVKRPKLGPLEYISVELP